MANSLLDEMNQLLGESDAPGSEAQPEQAARRGPAPAPLPGATPLDEMNQLLDWMDSNTPSPSTSPAKPNRFNDMGIPSPQQVEAKQERKQYIEQRLAERDEVGVGVIATDPEDVKPYRQKVLEGAKALWAVRQKDLEEQAKLDEIAKLTRTQEFGGPKGLAYDMRGRATPAETLRTLSERFLSDRPELKKMVDEWADTPYTAPNRDAVAESAIRSLTYEITKRGGSLTAGTTGRLEVQDPALWDQKGKIGVGTSVKQHLLNKIDNDMALRIARYQMAKSANVDYADKTTDERLIRDYALSIMEEEYRGETGFARFGKAALDTAQWMAEFYITNKVFGIGRSTGERIFESILGKYANTLGGKVATNIAGTMAGAGARTFAMPSTYQKIGELLATKINVDEKGNAILTPSEMSKTEAVIRGLASSYINTLTEETGGAFNSVLEGIGKSILRDTGDMAAFRKLLSKLPKGQIGSLAKVVFDKTRYQGPAGEFFEEVAGDFLTTLARTEPTGKTLAQDMKAFTERWTDAENVIQTMALVTLPGAVAIAPKMVVKARAAFGNEAGRVATYLFPAGSEIVNIEDAGNGAYEVTYRQGIPTAEGIEPQTVRITPEQIAEALKEPQTPAYVEPETPAAGETMRGEAAGGGPVIPDAVAERLKAELPPTGKESLQVAEPATVPAKAPTLPQDASATQEDSGAVQAVPTATEADVAPETPQNAATRLGITYNGPQEGPDGEIRGQMFTDTRPGRETTFMVAPGQSVEEVLQAKREAFDAAREAAQDKSSEPPILQPEDVAEKAPEAEKATPEMPTTVIQDQQGNPLAPVEVPVADLKLSSEVPNFKAGAQAETGVVEALKGTYERLGTAPIVVWERANGDKEVVTGRHRLDLARRTGEKTIPAQIVKESEGWTRERVSTLDAEANIRDNQGEVSDYANYFRNSDISKEEASRRGLLSRDKGRKGYAIGSRASDDLYAAFQAGDITADKAAAIADGAPNHPEKQALGIRFAEKHNAAEVQQYMKALGLQAPTTVRQEDLFGFDQSWQLEAEKMAKTAVEMTREKRRERDVLKSASKLSKDQYAKLLEQYGIKAGDKAAIADRLKSLDDELTRWENWQIDSDLVQQIRDKAGVEAPARGPEVQATLEGISEADAAPSGVERTTIDGKQYAKSEDGKSWLPLDGEGKSIPIAVEGGMDAPLLGERRFVSDEAADKAKKTLEDLLGGSTLFANPLDPRIIGALAVRGAWHLENLARSGVKSFSAWRDKMVEEFGEKVVPQLTAIWQEIRNTQREMWMQIVESTTLPDDQVISTQNAVTTEISDRLMMPPPVRGPRVSDVSSKDAAVATLNADPDAAKRLVQAWSTDQRAWRSEDDALVREHMRRLSVRLNDLSAQIDEANRNGDAALARDLVQYRTDVRADYAAAMKADAQVGTVAGQSLRARQNAYENMYDAESIIARYTADTGKLPSAELEQDVRDLAARNKESDARLAALQMERKDAAIDQTVKQLQDELDKERKAREDAERKLREAEKKRAAKPTAKSGEPVWRQKDFRAKNKVVPLAMAQEAEARIRATLLRTRSVPDPSLIKDSVILVASYLEGGVRTLAEATEAMFASFGEMGKELQPVMAEAWREANRQKTGRELVDAIKDEATVGETRALLRPFVRALVESGTTDRNEVVDAVHQLMLDADPNFTRDQTVDLLSGYGQYKQPTADEIERRIQEINAELLLDAKIRDVETTATHTAKPTGVGRHPPTTEARNLMKVLMEAMRRHGVRVRSSEEELKTLEDARQTRLRNQIADYQRAIDRHEMIPTGKRTVEWSDESKRLIAQRDAKKAEYEDLFGDELKNRRYQQRLANTIAATQRAIEDVKRRIATGDLAERTRTPLTSPELDAARAELARLNGDLRTLRDLADPEARDRKIADAYIRRLRKERTKLESALADPDYTRPAPKVPRRLSKAETDEKRINAKLKLDLRKKTRTPLEKAAGHLYALGAFLRLRAGGDLSYLGWQTRPVLYQDIGNLALWVPRWIASGGTIARPRFMWAKGVQAGFDAFFSEDEYRDIEQSIADWSLLDEATRAGLPLTKVGPDSDIGDRPEDYASGILESGVDVKLGGRNVNIALPLYRRGDRSASATMNTVLMLLYENQRNAYTARGVPITLDVAKKIAADAGDTAGRMRIGGNWPSLLRETITAASVGLWSAKHTGAKMRNAATLFHALSVDPVRRADGIKRLVGFTTMLAGLYGLTRAMGGDDDTLDLNPFSKNFGRLRIGNTRINVVGNEADMIATLMKFAFGRDKTAAGEWRDIDRADPILKMIRNKKSPLMDLISKSLTGEDYKGDKVNWGSEALQSAVYMWVMDATDAIRDNFETTGILPTVVEGAAVGATSMLGAGVNTYPDSSWVKLHQYRQGMAKKMYDKDIADLSYGQYVRLLRSKDAEQATLRRQVAKDAKNDDEITINRSEQNQAGREVVELMSDDASNVLEAMELRPNLSLDRSVEVTMPNGVTEKWRMNDDRYEKYKAFTAANLANRIGNIVADRKYKWSEKSPEEKKQLMSNVIEAAKKDARERVKNLP